MRNRTWVSYVLLLLPICLPLAAEEPAEIVLDQPLVIQEDAFDQEWQFFELARKWRKAWSGEFNAGVNGAAGNAERFNTRFGLDAKRSGPRANHIVSLLYAKGTANGEETEHKFISKLRDEWKFDESKWSLYTFANTTYDEFQNWDLRLVTGTGFAYQFYDTEVTYLQARAGAGASREFGGTNDKFVPEANLGTDFRYKLTERQSITAGAEYFPSFEDFGDYRLDSQAAWELLIDPDHNLTLKIGFMDRYQSRPEGAKRNDIDYFAQVGLKF